MKQNKHALTGKSIEGYILVFVLVVVLFQVISQLYPTATAAATTLNASGFPLGEMFTSGGALWYLVAAGILFLIYKSFSTSNK